MRSFKAWQRLLRRIENTLEAHFVDFDTEIEIEYRSA